MRFSLLFLVGAYADMREELRAVCNGGQAGRQKSNNKAELKGMPIRLSHNFQIFNKPNPQKLDFSFLSSSSLSFFFQKFNLPILLKRAVTAIEKPLRKLFANKDYMAMEFKDSAAIGLD